VVVAIALPLTLLRPLGEGTRSTPGDEPGSWLAVGTLADVRARGVTYVPLSTPAAGAFVIALGDQDPYALSAVPAGGTDAASGVHVVFCPGGDVFLDPTSGGGYDITGRRIQRASSVPGLSTISLRVSGSSVEIDPNNVSPGSTEPGQVPSGPGGCQTAGTVPLETSPGIGVPQGTPLPPIAVALPQSGMRVSSPIIIAGSADVFEATVNIRVLDANGEVIAESFAMATCGTGCRGDFSTQIDVPIDAEQPATIQVFEYSAKDGSMINTVEIPVTLVPDTSSATEGPEGSWFDASGRPVPNGSPDDTGNVLNVYRGAAHCQWKSVTFMNIGWPVGTLSNAQGDWRQYVRDPRGLFDDGALHVGYLSETALPSDATDTGYHRGPWRLWISPSQAEDAVFVVNADTGAVERWGRAASPILCK
jgi:Immunoglobulin-like domain of bacterial spore germination